MKNFFCKSAKNFENTLTLYPQKTFKRFKMYKFSFKVNEVNLAPPTVLGNNCTKRPYTSTKHLFVSKTLPSLQLPGKYFDFY